MYEEETTALVNHEYFHRDKESTKAGSAEALYIHQGRFNNLVAMAVEVVTMGPQSKLRGCMAGHEECAFCHEQGHWKKDYPNHKDKPSNKQKQIFSWSKVIMVPVLITKLP